MLSRAAARQALLPALTCLAVLLGASAPAAAQTSTARWVLEDVWLLPDVSHPSSTTPQPMTGAFEWTYTPGDFENGTGVFTSLDIPWSSAPIADLEFVFEPQAIEIVLSIDLHDHGVDLTLVFEPSLSPGQVSPIDTVNSSFDVEVGISHKGHVISGRAVPDDTTAWVDLGHALAGGNGTPSLAGSGEMLAGELVSLDLTNALEATTAALVVGVAELNAPFKGGVFVPDPLLIVAGLPTDSGGALPLSLTWPAGLPSGVTTIYQYWITDAAGPVGFAASNAVSGTTP